MATNWSIESKTKTSSTDNFTVEPITQTFESTTWENYDFINWEDIASSLFYNLWLISGKATARDSD